MNNSRQYPEGDCIAIYPDGEDTFVAVLGRICEGWTIIGHAEKRFIQVFPPNMRHPITITTQIEALPSIHFREGFHPEEDGWSHLNVDDWLEERVKFRRRG